MQRLLGHYVLFVLERFRDRARFKAGPMEDGQLVVTKEETWDRHNYGPVLLDEHEIPLWVREFVEEEQKRRGITFPLPVAA